MRTTDWYVADTSGIQWPRASVPSSGGVLPVEVTRLGSEPPWSSWRLRRTSFDPGTVEAWLVRQLRSAEAALLVYVLDGDFAALTALSGGTVVARLVAGEGTAAEYKEGAWALQQCAALHGGAWRESALDRLAMWSHLAPRPATVEALRGATGDDGDGTLALRLFALLGLPGGG